MDQNRHYLSIMLEELYDQLKTVQEFKTSGEAQEIENEIINGFYKKYGKIFNILDTDHIKTELSKIEKTRRASKDKDDEER